MSLIRKHSRLLLVAVCCIALGAGASAIASAGASSPTGKGGKAGQRAGVRGLRARGLRAAGLRSWARRAVQGELTLATRTGFATVSFDRGRISSVNGQQLTIAEGTKRTSDRTVTLTIPAGAQIRDNRVKATMSALKDGQRVIVLRAPKRTFVIARTPNNSTP